MNKTPKYTLRKSKRAKRVRIAVYCDGSVIVTSPFGIQQSIIDRFVSDKMQWIMDKINFFNNVDSKAIRIFSYGDYLKYKEKALKLIEERIEFYNKTYHFSFNKIRIKNQKTRWGSCSKNQNLNFNYKCLFLPKDSQDYIIVHEMCHLVEFNHSQKFWALVERVFPNYLEIKKKLRRHGLFYR